MAAVSDVHKETAKQAFETLRQSFDSMREKFTDPWNWHTYLTDEPVEEDYFGEGLPEEEDEDPEMMILKPKKRKNIDRLKSHFLALVGELNRAAHAADIGYYHMSVTPEKMKECVIVLGTSGDVDEEMLSEGASPEKIMAKLQGKLTKAHAKIAELEEDLADMKDRYLTSRLESEDRWRRWQSSAMQLEETQTTLAQTRHNLAESSSRESELQADCDDLYSRMVRASRLMVFKARQMLRDQLLAQNKKENLFYAFQGFIYIVTNEKEERIRLEREAERDAVEFALRTEVKFLLNESELCRRSVQRLTVEACRLKQERRGLALRFMHKNRRPFEFMEYLLWIWELWRPLRPELRLEKWLEQEQATRRALIQQFLQTSSQLAPMSQRIDHLRMDVVKERMAHDITKRSLIAAGARRIAPLVEQLIAHRAQELAVLHRIHRLDVEGKEERIAILEREIAEDKHIIALRGMIVELETGLRRALDRRQQKAFALPSEGGPKCAQCSRENLFRNWKCMSQMSTQLPSQSLAEEAAGLSLLGSPLSSHASPPGPLAPLAVPGRGYSGKAPAVWSASSPVEKEATYAPGWR